MCARESLLPCDRRPVVWSGKARESDQSTDLQLLFFFFLPEAARFIFKRGLAVKWENLELKFGLPSCLLFSLIDWVDSFCFSFFFWVLMYDCLLLRCLLQYLSREKMYFNPDLNIYLDASPTLYLYVCISIYMFAFELFFFNFSL